MGRLGFLALGLLGCYDPRLASDARPAEPDAVTADAESPGDGTGGENDAAPCPGADGACLAFSCAATRSCYQVCPPHANFDEAKTHCAEWGGSEVATLVVVGSAAENECVFAQLADDKASEWWFGHWIAYEQDSAGAEPDQGWRWLHPSGTSFTNWYAGNYAAHTSADEPNEEAGGAEDCAYMFRYSGMAGGWADATCTKDPANTEVGFVCEVHRQ